LALAGVGIWLFIQYLLPLMLPFLLGALAALAAEPAVKILHRRLKIPRPLAAGLGVGATALLSVGVVGAVGAVLLRQVTGIAQALPDLGATARQGIGVLEDFLVDLTYRTPEGIQPALTGAVVRFFDNGDILLDQMTQHIPGAVISTLGRVPDSALGIGTGLLSAFMISARLPGLRLFCREQLKKTGIDRYVPVLEKGKKAALGWLKAQGVLMLVTWLTVTVGFWLLGIRGGALWAVLVALVDAVPMLGTGIVLVPWALVSFLQGQQMRGLGLCALVGVATLLRTTLEPRLVGKHLGLDPLVTLMCLYAGYRLWGFWGLLLTPMLAGVLFSVLKKE